MHDEDGRWTCGDPDPGKPSSICMTRAQPVIHNTTNDGDVISLELAEAAFGFGGRKFGRVSGLQHEAAPLVESNLMCSTTNKSA